MTKIQRAFEVLVLGALGALGAFGQTITVIQGSDTVSSSRAVINTNFAELNTWKSKIGACSTGQVAIETTTSGVVCTTVAVLCPTCVTAAGTLTSHGVALGAGGKALGVTAVGGADTLLQGQGSSSDPSFVSLANCANDGSHALVYSTSSHLFACATVGGGNGDPAGYTLVTFSSTPTCSVTKNTGQVCFITLTGNVTSSTMDTAGITNSGRPRVSWRICQDSGGGHTFVWPTDILNHGTIDATASACSMQDFVWDGTNFQVDGNLNVTGAGANSIAIPGSSSGLISLVAPAVAGTGNATMLANSNTVLGIADPSDTKVVNFISTDGVQHRINQSGGGGTTESLEATNTTGYTMHASVTMVPFDTNAVVTSGGAVFHSTTVTNTRFIADINGVYQMCGYGTVVGGVAYTLGLYKNSNTTTPVAVSGGVGSVSYMANTVCFTMILSAADYVEVGTYDPSDGQTLIGQHASFTRLP